VAVHVPGSDTPKITRYAPAALSRTKSLLDVNLLALRASGEPGQEHDHVKCVPK